jgi:outer membrane receptor protein involved in Fe transport
VTVPLYAPGTLFGDRVHQLDIRMGKGVRLGRVRTTASLDVYNVFNVSPVRAYSAAFATWQQPQSILSPRFVKVVLQFDF